MFAVLTIKYAVFCFKVDAYAAAKLEESKQSTILSQRNQEKVVHQKREQMRYLAAKTEMNLQKVSLCSCVFYFQNCVNVNF